MRARKAGRRVAAALACTATATGLLAAAVAAPAAAATAAPAAAKTVVEQPFYADSGDSCRYGYTKGVLRWQLGPFVGPPPPVDVTGVVADRPVSASPSPGCGDDRRFSTATLTAYAQGVAVDRAAARVDNGVHAYRFRLANTTSRARIDTVTVQVCRRSLLPGPFDYCGRVQVYRAPLT